MTGYLNLSSERKNLMLTKVQSRDFVAYQPISGFGKLAPVNKVVEFATRLDVIYGFCEHSIGYKGKKFLVVGSHLGYNCFDLARNGCEVIGIEPSYERVEICMALQDFYGIGDNLKFYHGSITDFITSEDDKFDYVLFLNVFHHMMRQDEEQAWMDLEDIALRSEYIIASIRGLTTAKGLNNEISLGIPPGVVNRKIGRELWAYWR